MINCSLGNQRRADSSSHTSFGDLQLHRLCSVTAFSAIYVHRFVSDYRYTHALWFGSAIDSITVTTAATVNKKRYLTLNCASAFI